MCNRQRATVNVRPSTCDTPDGKHVRATSVSDACLATSDMQSTHHRATREWHSTAGDEEGPWCVIERIRDGGRGCIFKEKKVDGVPGVCSQRRYDYCDQASEQPSSVPLGSGHGGTPEDNGNVRHDGAGPGEPDASAGPLIWPPVYRWRV